MINKFKKQVISKIRSQDHLFFLATPRLFLPRKRIGMKIKSIHAREVLDSRGHPTVEAEINSYRAITPEGASKGKYEAWR